ncbi:TPA: O-antigen polymerase [Photobacterium damselae]
MLIINSIMFFFSLGYALYRLKKKGINALYNQFFIFNIFFTLYLIFPAIFFKDINMIFNWGIKDNDYNMSTLLVIYYFIIFQLFYFLSKDTEITVSNYSNKISKNSMFFLRLFYWLFVCYSLYILMFKGVDIANTIYTENNYEGEQPLSIYKIKNIAYLMIFIVPILYSFDRKIKYFILPFLLIILDFCQGTRTIALISFLIIYFSCAYFNRKIYFKVALIFLSLMIIVGIVSRYSFIDELSIPWYINALGEFRETYIALPYILGHGDYISKADPSLFIKYHLGAIYQPLFYYFTNDLVLPGKAIVDIVSRGYGLGANLIIESLYFSEIYTFILPWLIVLFLIKINKVIRRLRFPLPLIILCAVSFRLGVREGFFINIGFSVYYIIMYWGIFWLFIKVIDKLSHR